MTANTTNTTNTINIDDFIGQQALKAKAKQELEVQMKMNKIIQHVDKYMDRYIKEYPMNPYFRLQTPISDQGFYQVIQWNQFDNVAFTDELHEMINSENGEDQEDS